MTAEKPVVLRLGKWPFSTEKWDKLKEIATVVDCESQTREEFLKDLKTKYTNVTNIVRTFPSVEQTGRFDSEIIAALPDSVVSVSHNGAGYDQVDPQPLTDRNIQLSNVTVPVEAPTALTAVYLTLATMRNYQIGHDALVQGKWTNPDIGRGAKLGKDPEGQVVGILGMGGIGRAIRDRLVPFGFEKILYYNRSRLDADLEGEAQYVGFDELLAQSDVLIVSVPLNPKTHHLVNKEVISKMKDGVIIVNTARGAIIDEKVLIEELKSGKVGAFGSDVFEHEPEVPKELYEMPNVVSLPHMGTWTKQALKNMEEFTVANVEHQIKTGKLLTIVPEQKDIDFKHPARA
ncbi:hypothetical protein FT663_04002 [Candidozyma haemuli var. vulneris]|uniref:Glyoxylate reductase 1 n=1 Tax=Candidozyma haemuli TaxID=45357 RepID=A0A2V1AUQ4_9ASCO|nr:hypothetical protein CXQ85_000550 [[Candida] haemuloni]KAF3986355.1 hypothetical protein FT662_04608 [[Candida] haemuloni var. vulneris]KAF3988533.1 hypothetical protein FT663_04002 [[Candida] haemuloni var. vulneris]PVH21568.1 hypothetical protein CXQ85_000550 [[Candida] haemuloni]